MNDSRKNRRRRFVYRTLNSEYHVFDDTCVAVRDRRSGAWIDSHIAVAKQVQGGARVFANGAVLPTREQPEVGHPFYFAVPKWDRQEQLITSRLMEITRPAFEDLDRYPQTAC